MKMIFAVKRKGEPMGDLIDRQKVIDALIGLIPFAIFDKVTESYSNGLTDAYNLICQLPSVQPDFSTVEKIDKAYDDGYKCGYLQAKFDYEADTKGEQDG